MRKFSLLTVLVLSIMLIASCATAPESVDATTQISVQGSCEIKVAPDYASFYVRINETADDTATAQQQANGKVAAVLSILRSFNVGEKNIQTSNLSFSTEYYWDEMGRRVTVGQTVSQSINVKLSDISVLSEVIDELGSKIDGISLNSVSFGLEDSSESYAKAREMAIEHARQKAEIYAKSAGLSLGRPLTVSEGSVYLSASNAYTANAKTMATGLYEDAVYAAEAPAAAADFAYSTEIPAGEVEISATVSVIYLAY